MNALIEQDICELLLLDGPLRAGLLPSGGDDPQLFWGLAPPTVASVQRYAILARVSDESDFTNDGASGMEDANYTLVCYSRASQADATTLANLAKAALKTMCGQGRITHDGRTIQGIFYNGQVDAAVDPWDGGEVSVWGRVVRFRVVYEDNETA